MVHRSCYTVAYLCSHVLEFTEPENWPTLYIYAMPLSVSVTSTIAVQHGQSIILTEEALLSNRKLSSIKN